VVSRMVHVMIDGVVVCLKEMDVLACCSLSKALLICHYLIGDSG